MAAHSDDEQSFHNDAEVGNVPLSTGSQGHDEKGKLNIDVTPQRSPSSPRSNNNRSLEVPSYMIVFFLAMVGHELALEAASTEFAELDALPYAVTLFQFGFCVLLPLVVSRGEAIQTFPKTLYDCTPYIKLSLVVFGATALATMSLHYVSYPTKVVFKSAKLIPTMMVSTILNHKRHGWLDYMAALLLCAGAAGYSFGSSRNGTSEASDSYPGLILLTISILCDALVPNLQQRLMTASSSATGTASHLSDGMAGSSPKQQQPGLSATSLMVNVNVVGFAGLIVYMVLSGHFGASVSASLTHPRLLLYLTMVGIGLSTAVLAYTRLIKASGSVVAVAVATLRKVATVVLSYIVFPKAILPIHVVAGLSVLAGILLSNHSRQREQRKRTQQP